MTARYDLDCTDCAFQTTIVGAFTEAVDAIEAHRAEAGACATSHFVNVHRRD